MSSHPRRQAGLPGVVLVISSRSCRRRRQTMKTNRGCCRVVTHDASSLAGRAQFISALSTIHLAHSPARNAVHSAATPSSRLLYCALYEPAQLAPFHHPAVCLSVCPSSACEIIHAFTHHSGTYILIPYLHDTTGCQTGCTTGCQAGCITGLTTG